MVPIILLNSMFVIMENDIGLNCEIHSLSRVVRDTTQLTREVCILAELDKTRIQLQSLSHTNTLTMSTISN